MTYRRLGLVLLATFALAACDDASTVPTTDAGARTDAARPPSPPPDRTIGPAARPATLVLPTAHDGETPLPLVFLLHGFSVSSTVQDGYFRFSDATRTLPFYLVLADGTPNSDGDRFWNATPACCNFEDADVDDVAYLGGLIDAAMAEVPIDPDRVFFVGHSNGGYMSYRLACELSDRIAAIVSIAGSDYLAEDDCVPEQPVSVLQIHGDVDDTVLFDGEPDRHPSAADVVARWAGRAGCDATEELEPIELVASVDGAETKRTKWTGCDDGLGAELWTLEGVGHVPGFQRSFAPTMLDWLNAHAR